MTWGPTLTPTQEELLDSQVDVIIPRRIIGLTRSRNTLINDIIPDLTNLKDLHKVFYDWFDAVAVAYEDEFKHYSGDYILSPITDTDLTDAVNRVTGSRYFPDGWIEFAPEFIDEAKGIDDVWTELNEACMHEIAAALAVSLDAGLNGTASSTTTGAINNTGSIVVPVTAGTGTNFTVGKDCYVLDPGGFDRVVGRITAKAANDITITRQAWCGADNTIASGATVSDAPTPKDTVLKDSIDKLETYIANQKTALQSNDDDISYSGVQTDIATAITNATDTINNYDSSWTYAQLVTFLSNRKTFMTGTRLGQITQALDTASDGIYDRRYDWINYLINRKIGSWERLVRHEDTIGYLNEDITLYGGIENSLEEWRSG